MYRNQKGFWGTIINLAGVIILLTLFGMASADISDSMGGAEAMLNETMTNETFRDNFIWHHVAFDMVTPWYPMEVGPYKFYIALDDGGFLFILFITFVLTLIAYITLKIFYDIHWPWLIVLFIIMGSIAGFAWQNYWLMVYFDTGANLGMTQEGMVETLKGTQDVVANPWVLGMVVFSMFFILFRGKGLFHH